MTQSYLWDLLKKVEEEELPRRLRSTEPGLFHSLFVDYEPPFVERLWFQVDRDHRVFLHRILPCKASEALWHPHPWPSIVKVVDTGGGYYEHGVGYEALENTVSYVSQKNNCPTPVAVVQRIRGQITYVMDSPKAWHYVSPEKESWSIMIVGPMFPSEEVSKGYVKPTKKLNPLPADRVLDLIGRWDELLEEER